MAWFDYSQYLTSLNFGLEDLTLEIVNHQIVYYIAVILLLLIFIVKYLQKPLNIVRDFSKKNEGKKTVQKSRENFIYPNGWIPVTESSLLMSNEIKRITFCGQRIVLLRGSNGKAFALDAFCPHLGADFSVGGKIVKHCDHDCVRCPFHGWVFRAQDGLCVEVPYAQDKKPPSGAKVKAWKCIEMNGFIYIWYHVEDSEPKWFPQKVDEIGSEKWSYIGRTEHIVNCSNQEITENGADFAHFGEIHSPSIPPGESFSRVRNFLIESFQTNWQNTWQICGPPNEHIASLTVKFVARLFGYTFLEAALEYGEQIGPAIVNFRFLYRIGIWKFRGTMVFGVTPLEANKQRMVHLLFMEKKWLSTIVGRFILFGETAMVDRDCEIWGNKKYLDNPKLVKEEERIVIFRRWYKQFFTKPSQAISNGLDSW